MADKIHSVTNRGLGLEHRGLSLDIKSLASAVKSLALRIKSLIMTLVVSDDTLNTFKHRLDKFWCNEDLSMITKQILVALESAELSYS